MLSPEDDADRVASGKIFGETQGLGNSALAFLIGIIQVLQAEIAAVSEQARENLPRFFRR